MKKIKYYYNTHSLRYERLEENVWVKVWRAVGFVSAAVVFALVIVYLAYTYMDSPKEKQLKREIAQLKLQYNILNRKLDELDLVLEDLETRDDKTYRVIMEAEPIPGTVRQAGVGGSARFNELQ